MIFLAGGGRVVVGFSSSLISFALTYPVLVPNNPGNALRFFFSRGGGLSGFGGDEIGIGGFFVGGSGFCFFGSNKK